MGARYYDPQSGRFLSPNPLGYPTCLNLYTYANGDPINYRDPDGRFFVEAWHNPRIQGTIQAVGGIVETGFGAGMIIGTKGVAAPVGWPIMAHGLSLYHWNGQCYYR